MPKNAARRAPVPRRARPMQHDAQRPDDEQRDEPLAVRRVLVAARRVSEDRVHRKPGDDDPCADDLAAPYGLVREEVAERQREDDGRDEQRLDDREPAVVESDRLHDVADEQCPRTDEPPVASRELRERAQVVRGDAELERALLLQRGRDSEEERRDKSPGSQPEREDSKGVRVVPWPRPVRLIDLWRPSGPVSSSSR